MLVAWKRETQKSPLDHAGELSFISTTILRHTDYFIGYVSR